MRSKRLGAQVWTAAAIAVALMILGAPSAQAAPNGTLQAPYESAASAPHCSSQPTEPPCAADAFSDVDGNIRVEARAESPESYSSDSASSSAVVVAVHQIDADVQSATYTVHVHVSERNQISDADSGCSDSDYDQYDCGAWANADLTLEAWAEHSTCRSCSDPTPEFSSNWSTNTDVSLTLVVRNHAGGTVPPGIIRIRVGMSASADTMTYYTTCSLFVYELCGPPASASVRGASQVIGIDYQTEAPKTPNQRPTADFTHHCWGGTWDTGAPTTCGYDATGSSDPDGRIVEYNWDFGDGSTLTGVSYPRTYRGYASDWNSSASYFVTLTVVDDTGAIDTESRWVTPNPPNQPPTAAFTVSCAGNTCTFDPAASSDPDGWIGWWEWDFGDGSGAAGGGRPQHTYADGTKSYVVTLTVFDDEYGTDTESKTIIPNPPNQPPTARFTVSCTGSSCNFDAASSTDPDGQITGYAWTFGDGSVSATGPGTQHRYAEGTGNYLVTLTVTDNRGGTDGESRTVKCAKKNPNKPTTCS